MNAAQTSANCSILVNLEPIKSSSSINLSDTNDATAKLQFTRLASTDATFKHPSLIFIVNRCHSVLLRSVSRPSGVVKNENYVNRAFQFLKHSGNLSCHEIHLLPTKTFPTRKSSRKTLVAQVNLFQKFLAKE